MGCPNYCCNPLNLNTHKCVRKSLHLVTDKCSQKFKPFVGLYICRSCRTMMHVSKKLFQYLPFHCHKQLNYFRFREPYHILASLTFFQLSFFRTLQILNSMSLLPKQKIAAQQVPTSFTRLKKKMTRFSILHLNVPKSMKLSRLKKLIQSWNHLDNHR